MSIWDYILRFLRRLVYLYDEVDTEAAAKRINNAIWFKGPTVWILAFSIVIASVGLNVNSTAVIIGAMLISPLMGPIIGTGMALGTNDFELLKAAVKNLLIMVLISLLASTLFFLLSPLSLVNPTELEARTSPTIYDVMIALFGGLAGILENSRKEQGTAIAGVAIATALMPPLCTAGYGLAHWDMHFFFGALYLFIINSIFIALATYLMVKYLRFRTVTGIDAQTARRRRNFISVVLIVVLIPSIWSAFVLIRENNFERNARSLVENNRVMGRSYIYEFKVQGRHADIFFTGDPLTDDYKASFYQQARLYGIKDTQLTLKQHSIGMTQADMDRLIEDIYTKTESEAAENAAQLQALQLRLDQLSAQIQALQQSADTTSTVVQPAADSLSF